MSAARSALAIVRSLGGTLLLFASGFAGGGAAFLSGAHGDFRGLDPERLFRAQALGFTLGCPTLAVLGVLAARSGRGPVANAGVVLAFVAIGTGIYGWVRANHSDVVGFTMVTVSFVLALVSAFMMWSKR